MRWSNLFFLLLTLCISCDTGNNLEDPQEDYFVKFYGGDGEQSGVDLVSLNDGGFVLLGNSKREGLPQQIYLVRVDAKGMVVWQREFGDKDRDDNAKDLELTDDGRLIVAAETANIKGDKDVYLKILTIDNVAQDSVRIGLKTLANQDADETVNSISKIQGGYIVVGSTTRVLSSKTNDVRDALHLKFTSNLTLIDPATGLWSNTSGLDDSDDVLIKLIQIDPSRYYGFGYTNTVRNGSRDYKYWAFSLGSTGTPTNNGSELLDKLGNQTNNEFLNHVITSPLESGEGYVLSGISKDGNQAGQTFIVKLQKNLFIPGEDNVLAQQYPIENGQIRENIARVIGLSTGGFLLATVSVAGPNEPENISMVKLSNTFTKVWETPILFGGIGDDWIGALGELPDQRIIMLGTMTLGEGAARGQKKIALFKMNKDGKLSE